MHAAKIVFIFILSLGLGLFSTALAQQYIDIDLSPPPKPKKADSTSSSGSSKKIPKQKATKQPVKTNSKAATKNMKKPPLTSKPVAKPNKPVAKPVPKPAAKPTQPPSPPPAPVVAQPSPPPAPVAAPAPKKELNLDDPILKDSPSKPSPAPTVAVAEADQKSQAENVDYDSLRFKNRHGFTVDYSTWYETLKIRNKPTNGLLEGTSHYFGVALNYDYTVYREKYGFAVTIGGVTGNAQAGTKDAGDYYERRISWTGFRGAGRLFYRANNRIDLGLGFMAMSKSTIWPEEENFVVLPQNNPHYFYYIDTRWRLNYRFELVQSLGAHLRSYAMAWMLGLTYTMN